MRVTEGMVHHRSVRAGTDGQDTLKLKAEVAAALLGKATCLNFDTFIEWGLLHMELIPSISEKSTQRHGDTLKP